MGHEHQAVWKSLNCSTPPKEATEVGRALTVKWTKKQVESAAKYKEFMDAVKPRFALIDVQKAQKVLNANKPKEQDLAIHNELKIITTSEDVYMVWSELISAHSQGELADPDIGKKFKNLSN